MIPFWKFKDGDLYYENCWIERAGVDKATYLVIETVRVMLVLSAAVTLMQ